MKKSNKILTVLIALLCVIIALGYSDIIPINEIFSFGLTILLACMLVCQFIIKNKE